MGVKKIVKLENSNVKKTDVDKNIKEKGVSLESQERLAEILNDSPRIASLNGTEWEIRALRMGSQWMIAQEVIKINKANSKTFGDIIKQFATNIPSVIHVITIALLNDKNKIFVDGDEKKGLSTLYHATFDTLMWDCNVDTFGEILLNVLQMIDCNFFLESHRILEIFRESTMARKTKTLEQK